MVFKLGNAGYKLTHYATLERAMGFWRDEAEAAERDGRAIIIAESEHGLVGVVEVIPAGKDNQPHRAEVAKMLVYRRARRKGIGTALMRIAEDVAREMGKTLLTLDTVPGSAGERLYTRLNWTHVGIIPNYALMPDGVPCATRFFYKHLD